MATYHHILTSHHQTATQNCFVFCHHCYNNGIWIWSSQLCKWFKTSSKYPHWPTTDQEQYASTDKTFEGRCAITLQSGWRQVSHTKKRRIFYARFLGNGNTCSCVILAPFQSPERGRHNGNAAMQKTLHFACLLHWKCMLIRDFSTLSKYGVQQTQW